MTHPDPFPGGDAEREALATLFERFAADRDVLMAGIQRTETALMGVGARLDALAGEVAELRRERSPEDGASLRALLMGVVEDVRLEVRRSCLEMGEQAARHAERAAAAVAESSAEALAEALGQVRAELVTGLESVQRLAVAGGERASRALAQVTELERREHDLDALRAALATLRDEILRRVGEGEARFGVRVDSIVAGLEAEGRALRDALWDRIAGTERRLQEAEAVLAAVRAELPRSAAALAGLTAVQGALDHLRDGLEATHARLGAIEARQAGAGGGIGGMVACVRDEVVALVMAVVSVGAVVGRLTFSLLR